MKIIKQLFKYYLYLISIFFIGRVALFILYFDRFENSGVEYWYSFIYGLRMDTIGCFHSTCNTANFPYPYPKDITKKC